METILVPMEEVAMMKLDGTLVYVLLVTKKQTAKLTQIFRSRMFFFKYIYGNLILTFNGPERKVFLNYNKSWNAS